MVFLLSFLIMAVIIAGMAIGAMAGRGPLKGSCGGLSAVGIEGRCEICGDDPKLCKAEEADSSGEAGRSDSIRGSEGRATRTEFYDAS